VTRPRRHGRVAQP